jgi:SAM-dependent methyltransferase
MVNKNCPLCDTASNNEIMLYKNIGSPKLNCNIVCCRSCGHHFSVFYNNINVAKLYSGGHYKLLDIRGSLFDRIISLDDKFIIQQLSKFKISSKKLLDFGCGKGRFIYQASKYGWKVKGIETAEARAEFGKTIYSLDISTSEYQKGLIQGGPFNIITLFHVIEHLYSPKKLLNELLQANLSSDGYVVIEVPLFESLQSKIAGKYWLHLDPPLHISHFTKSVLLNFLDELNLKPIKFQYFSIHLGMLGMVQSLMSLFGYRKMIISELKFRRTKRLMVAVCSVLPVALLLESVAVLLKRGGVFRVYCKFKP